MTYTYTEAETALCLWELICTGGGLTPETVAAFAKLRERVGTAALRYYTLLELVNPCEAAWRDAEDTGTQLEPFDWEHCPAFLNDWVAAGGLGA
ncbi:hypothetical protein UFOVP4_36 [uncultured Caudovirales phage]|uniref:Uncharacterized protein n=1 Tax=uncultured Caudovirales phage TaxID=2100421 RepID=A0A6J5KKN0_9CAUD|nr:hypothetical protein UFOVP4_36 [uncultured Caudovirales phage]CAB4241269.1 hypothetical protein UFOVP64_24 [uncultured Caudovirales phage]CAB5078997.1 hypothetical protein UFOVP145_38 [uncultured Caudovirales phage]